MAAVTTAMAGVTSDTFAPWPQEDGEAGGLRAGLGMKTGACATTCARWRVLAGWQVAALDDGLLAALVPEGGFGCPTAVEMGRTGLCGPFISHQR